MVKNNYLVNKLRKTQKDIAFREGQIVQFEQQKEIDLNERLNYFETSFKKQEQKLLNQINSKDINEIKRQSLLNRYEEKSVLERRKFVQVNKELENFEELIVECDNTAKKNLEVYIGSLEIKYPKHEYSVLEKEEINQKLELLKKGYENEILVQREKNKQYIEKQDLKITKVSEVIAKEKLLVTKLENEIKHRNLSELDNLENENLSLKQKIEELENVEQNNKFLKKIHDNKVRRLNDKLNYNKNYIDFVTNKKDVHLSIYDLKMYFGGIKALDGVSFDVKKGEIFGLIGPNGAGKTTVFNCITQFYQPTAGNSFFLNKEGNHSDLNRVKTHKVIEEGIARSFQNIEMVWELSVLDNMLVAAHSIIRSSFLGHVVHSSRMKKEEEVLRLKAYNLLKMLGIEEYAIRIPYGLPYGILKKIELARTLMTDPEMIILDEPAAGLNDTETQDLAKTIKQINDELGITIFLVEHDMQLVMSISDTVCAINFGKMLAIGTPKEIQANEDVRRAYLGDD